MYESPITKIYGEIHDEIIRKDEDHLMAVVTQNVGYQVDRDDLIKALQYDRDQYRKGYLDGKRKVLEQIRAEIEQITDTMGVSYNQYVSKIDVLQIIDKYKEESEEE